MLVILEGLRQIELNPTREKRKFKKAITYTYGNDIEHSYHHSSSSSVVKKNGLVVTDAFLMNGWESYKVKQL